MKRQKLLLALVGVVYALGLPTAKAEDNITNIISNTLVNNGAGNFIVGTNGINNYLQIDTGGQLVGVNFGIIGSNATANANAALVTGVGSVWLSSSQLHLGSLGDSNTLTVADGATVEGQRIFIGTLNGSDFNSAVVTGTNSVLRTFSSTADNIVVGRNGSYNSLTVSNGGAVVCPSPGVLIVGNAAASSNNWALVTGPGSTWSGDVDFTVGGSSQSNNLTVADGGAVTVLNSLVVGGPAASARNNAVLVTGTNSVWSGFGVMYIGTSGASNSLTIADGGTVSSGEAYVGTLAGAHYNTALVTGPGSTYASGSAISLGAVGGASSNRLAVVGGGKVTALADLNIGTGAASAGNTVLVTGTDSVLDITGATVIGTTTSGQGNSLTIGGGARAALRNVLLQAAGGRFVINGGTLQAKQDHTAFVYATNGNVYIQSGGIIVDSNDKTIRFDAPLEEDAASPAGGVTKIGGGVLRLNGTNTYTGSTSVEAGSFGGDCSLLSSALLIKSGATLAPGSGIGRLAVAGGITNEPGSSTVLEITSDTLARDEVVSSNNIALNGILVVTNLGTNAFVGGETFVLYQSLVGITGNFVATNLPPLANPNLSWQWTLTPVSLPTTPVASLSLSVVSLVATTPTNITATVSGGALDLSWPGSHLGWYAQSNSVDIADSNSWFDIAGSQTTTNLSIPINPALPKVFYRLRLP